MTDQKEQPTDKSIWLWPDNAPAELTVGSKSDSDSPAAGWLDSYLIESDKPCGAIIVFPGGGYAGRANHEAGVIARRFNQDGLHAFVCHYHVAPSRHPVPLLDAARAVRIVRSNAEKWGILPDKIAVLGFSAGGHLVGHLGTCYDEAVCEFDDEIQQISARPDAIIACYAVLDPQLHVGSYKNLLGEGCSEEQMKAITPIYRVHSEMPPVFMWSTADDTVVPVGSSLNFAAKLTEVGIPYELHVFPHGQHGLGLAEDTKDISTWPKMCTNWVTHLRGG